MEKLFNPKTVAVFGATNNEDSVGYAIMNNLVGSGYQGVVYPINLKRKSVFGIKAYKTLKDTEDEIDLAVIATPSATVPGIVEQCGEYKVGGILIISAGFLEAGEEGKKMVDSIKKTAKKYNIPIIGPNCLGFIKPSIKLNVSFANKMALPGNIALISQSGALCTAILDWSVSENVGFSHFISIGSMIDVSFGDLIDYLDKDPNTSSIIIYMESMTKSSRFFSAARAFSRNKPILVLKAGKSEAGAKVALSHTGTLAGSDIAFESAFKRAGMVSVETIDQLFNGAQALSKQPRPKGDRLAIVTNAGGPGVLATDLLVKLGGQLAPLSDDAIRDLNKILPPMWSHNNPIDVLGDASEVEYGGALEVLIQENNVDAILVILTPQSMTDPVSIAKEVVRISKKYSKTILASWMGSADIKAGQEILDQGKIPTFVVPEKAITTFMDMVKYTKNIDLLYQTPANIPSQFAPEKDKTRELFNNLVKENRYILNETEAKEVLRNYQIPVTQFELATTEEEAGEISERIGFPLVMKIASPDILHKTDAGGVALNIQSKEEAIKKYRKIVASAKVYKPDADIHGVMIEEMVDKKYELIIGSKKDPIFGPIIIFGMGGVAVEVFKDLNVALPPLNMALAQRLIENTKIYKLLAGYRGMKGVDIKSIQFLLYKFAYLIMDFPEILEIDINPFAVDEHSGVVLDAKIVLDEEAIANKVQAYDHLMIAPYPAEYTYHVKLLDDTDVLIRPIKPEDEPNEKEMFANFSKQTLYFRFFGYIKDITHDMLTRFTQIDYNREMALIGEITVDGKTQMIGVSRIVSDLENHTAEFAIVVADPWQGKGVGAHLMDKILEVAKRQGLKKIYASVMKANDTMVQMFKSRDFTFTSVDINVFYVEREV
ncbi:MAG: bifunctional acetate--CoA ligase family protein/GNAT family N-acetyltransferase [Saprospiraceae bacterium]|nr:bifunctional acetate--CoA ligase family protein/GNAT family N-acetyltransferase [Saprospiraceae bacterium]